MDRKARGEVMDLIVLQCDDGRAFAFLLAAPPAPLENAAPSAGGGP